jgi:hypothetical protein
MIIEDLKQIDTRYRQEKPGLFEFATPDRPATEQQLEDVERSIGVRLPPSYRTFLGEFGGGTFRFVVIFSADPDSEWYLPNQQSKASRYLPDGLLAFSDDYAGGNYVFKVVDGEAQEAVFYWHTDGSESSTKFKDMMEFVARYAYEPA